MKRVDFGRKYEFKVDANPAPGKYNPDSALMKTRSQAAIITEKVSTYQRPPESLPDPGQYDGSFKKFGDDTKPFRIGEKKETKYDPNLGPGYYQQDEAIRNTLPRSQAAVIKESKPYQKAPEPTPDAGDSHLRAFGS